MKGANHKSELKARQARLEDAKQYFQSQAENYDHAVLVYLGSPQESEAVLPQLREEYLAKGGAFAYVDFRAAGPCKGRAGLFRYVLGTLVEGLRQSVKDAFGETISFEPDFCEYERKAQSEEYRYLYLRHPDRADLMMQGEEPIPNREAAQEIWEQTFVEAATTDFVSLIQRITEKVGWRRIVLFLDRLDVVDQFLPALQAQLVQPVISANKNVLFVVTYARPDPPKWDGYAFEDRHVQYHPERAV